MKIMNKRLIIFGTGKIAEEATDFFGAEKIAYYCDNNTNKQGEFFHGKLVLSFEQYTSIIKDYFTVIATGYFYAQEIKEQLKRHKISSLLYQNIRDYQEQIEVVQSEEPKNIEFYLVDAFEIMHFLPLYNELINKGYIVRFVAEPQHMNVAGEWFDYENALRVLKSLEVDYSTRCNINAAYAITTQDSWNLVRYEKAKKISYSYGCAFGKDYYMNSQRKVYGFDYYFVHGDFCKDIMKSKNLDCEIKVMGFPKHYNSNRITDEERNTILDDLGINTDKKILVYLPTWDKESSIENFSEAIKELQDYYFIVTKPHHCTDRLSELSWQRVKIHEISDLVLPAEYPVEKIAFIGDGFLIDAKSGVATEIVFLNPRAHCLLITPREDINNYFYSDIFDLFKVTNNPLYVKELIGVVLNEKLQVGVNLEYYIGKRDLDYLSEIVDEVFC